MDTPTESKNQRVLPITTRILEDDDNDDSKPKSVDDHNRNSSKKRMARRGIYAAISYMICAVLLIMFNKSALSSYNFPYVNVITLFQMTCSCCLLYILKQWKIISFISGENPIAANSGQRKTTVLLVPSLKLIQTLPLSISYLVYMLVSMESVRGISVPMYTTLRRTTVAVTMAVEYLLAGQSYSVYVVGSVAIIVLGAFVAAARDLSFDLYSYTIVFVSNICTAVYLASIARIGKSSGLNSFGLMWCNGIVCGPILLLCTFIRGDLQKMMNFPYLSSPGFQGVMLLSCIMAFLLNYTVFLNTTLNSALTQSICGNLKDVFTIGLGWLLFGGLPFDWLNIVGQILGFLGSGLYAYCKVRGK